MSRWNAPTRPEHIAEDLPGTYGAQEVTQLRGFVPWSRRHRALRMLSVTRGAKNAYSNWRNSRRPWTKFRGTLLRCLRNLECAILSPHYYSADVGAIWQSYFIISSKNMFFFYKYTEEKIFWDLTRFIVSKQMWSLKWSKEANVSMNKYDFLVFSNKLFFQIIYCLVRRRKLLHSISFTALEKFDNLV